MYRGFKLTIADYEKDFNNFYLIGKKILEEQKNTTQKVLKDYIDSDGILNFNLIEKDWFPTIDSHIFISHSHKDEKLAVSLTGYLYKNFNLKCFVDSLIWEYSNDLLKEIDKKYCLLENKKTYDYDKRNISTSYVHNVLLMALTKMIDKTECLLFLNTPSSISITNIINNEEYTFSPWLYSELKISEIIRKPFLDRIKQNEQIKKIAMDSGIIGKLSVGTKHLVDLFIDDIKSIPTSLKEPYAVLDYLYSDTYTKFLYQINN
jgi:hypothetical protein